MNQPARRNPLILLGGLLALYLAVPLGAFLVRLASSSERGFHQPGLFPALLTSVVTASISTAIIGCLGIPLAYLLSSSKGKLLGLVGFIVQLPLALPPLMSGILLIYVFGPYTATGNLFNGRLTDSLAGIVLAQTFVASPFLIVVARAAFSAIDPALFDLAAGLGLGPLARFCKVGLPVARGGLRAGLLLAWLRAFGEYGATVILAYHPYSLPVFTYVQFSGSGLSTTEAPTALALAVAAVVVILARARWRPRRRELAAVPPVRLPPMVEGSPLRFDLDLLVGTFHLAVGYAGTSSQLAVLGPSGSGKSVTLRCLAGLFGPEAGSVHLGGRDLTALAPVQRGLGYLPQGGVLFPHLTVWRQLMFGTRADPALAAYWLDRLGLRGLENRLPQELSGGQRQRVGLAQALSRSPSVLLLDEPFSALDAPVREELRVEMRQLQKEIGLSTVLVTHDPQEAAMLASEILLIVDGALVQSGSRRQLFGAPASLQAARLLGLRNICPGVVRPSGGIACQDLEIDADVGDLAAGAAIWWSIQPEQVSIQSHEGIEVLVIEILDLGSTWEACLQLAPQLVLRGRGGSISDLVPGESCRAVLPRAAIAVWPRTD